MSDHVYTAGLISPSDIADLAGKTRAAVSYWRKQEDDFPKPVAGTTARPLFDRAAVESWLSARGSLEGDERSVVAVWAALNSARGVAPIDSLVEELHRLLAIRWLASSDEATRRAWDAVRSQVTQGVADALYRAAAVATHAWPAGSRVLDLQLVERLREDHLTQLVTALDAVETNQLATVSDNALRRLIGGGARSGGEHGLPDSRTAAILAAAARKPTGVVYDPACGIAQTLIALAAEPGRPTRIIGNDINLAAHVIASVRALLRGLDAEFLLSDVLLNDPDPSLRADVVVAEPPFGMRWDSTHAPFDERWRYGVPPKSSSDLAWVQHALHHLAPAGTAYIVTSMGPLFRGGAEQTIRSGMVTGEMIEAIVALPGKLLPHTSIPLALWVVRRPEAARAVSGVTFIDASDEADIPAAIGSWLDAIEVGDEPGVPHMRVSANDLLADGANLSPSRWIARTDTNPAVVRQQLEAALNAVDSAMAALTNAPTAVVDRPHIGASRTPTIRELLALDVASHWVGRIVLDDLADEAAERAVVTTGAVKSGLTDLDVEARFAGQHLGERVTDPGDVLFTTMGTVRAVVDHDGGHLPAKGVNVLRLDLGTFDPEFVAFSLASQWNAAHQRGTTITHAVVKDLEIPVLPLAEQRAVVAEVTRLRALANQAKALADAATTAESAVLDMVRFGGTDGR